MSAAMALIAGRAAGIGARHVLTVVGLDDIASLKGCRRAGFDPLLLHRSTRLGLGTLRRDRGVAGGRPAPDGEDLNLARTGSDQAPGRRFKE